MTRKTPFAWGIARVDLGRKGTPIRVAIPHVNWGGADAAFLDRLLAAMRATPPGDEFVANIDLATAPRFVRLAAARALVRANQAGYDQRDRNAGERTDDEQLGDGEDHAASEEVAR